MSLSVQDVGGSDVSHLFEAEVTLREGRTFEITVMYAGGLESSEFHGTLVLSTNDPDHERIELKIGGWDS